MTRWWYTLLNRGESKAHLFIDWGRWPAQLRTEFEKLFLIRCVYGRCKSPPFSGREIFNEKAEKARLPNRRESEVARSQFFRLLGLVISLQLLRVLEKRASFFFRGEKKSGARCTKREWKYLNQGEKVALSLAGGAVANWRNRYFDFFATSKVPPTPFSFVTNVSKIFFTSDTYGTLGFKRACLEKSSLFLAKFQITRVKKKKKKISRKINSTRLYTRRNRISMIR